MREVELKEIKTSFYNVLIIITEEQKVSSRSSMLHMKTFLMSIPPVLGAIILYSFCC